MMTTKGRTIRGIWLGLTFAAALHGENQPDEASAVHGECRTEFFRQLRLTLGLHELQFRLVAEDRRRLLESESLLPDLFEAVLHLTYPGDEPSLRARLEREPSADDAYRTPYLELCRRAGSLFVDSLFMQREQEAPEAAEPPGRRRTRLDWILASLGLDAGDPAPRPSPLPERSQLDGHWGLEAAGFRAAHRLTRGDGVRVTVIGSGIDLTSDLVSGLRFDVSRSASMVGRSGPPWSERPPFSSLDTSGGGTVMAALVGVYAPDAEISVVRVVDDPDPRYPFWPARQVARAIDLAVANGVDVIVVAASFDRDFAFLRSSCRRAYENHAVVVAPSRALGGASLERMSRFPAHYNTTVAVSGVVAASDGSVAWWNGSGRSHFNSVAAPASLGTDPRGGAVDASWASSVAGGLVALLVSRIERGEGELRGQYFQRIYEVLTTSAAPRAAGFAGFSPEVGYGMIDAFAAVGAGVERYTEKRKKIEEDFALRLRAVNEQE